MTDSGAWELLIAITECAYKDYKTGLRYIKKCVQMPPGIFKHYKTALNYLTGYDLGEYLKEKAKGEVNEIQ